MLSPGLTASRTYPVSDADTATALGSGDVPVLATPRLLAWCEAVTCAAVEGALDSGRTTVGSRVSLQHDRPSAVGSEVEVRASLVHVDGRLLRFEVVAEQIGGAVVAHGEVARVAVDRERFLSRI